MPENPEVTAEVVAKVTEGIKSIGALSKENKEAIGNLAEQFRGIEKKQGDIDPITQERLDKLAADVSTRHEAMDTAVAKATKDAEDFNKRMDEIEVAAKRVGRFGSTGNAEQDRKLIEDYMLMEKSFASAQQVKLGFKQVLNMEKEPNIEKLNAYKDSFYEYLQLDEKAMSAESYKALQVGIDVDGGYTVTPFMSNRISQRMFEIDPIRQLVSIETIGTDAYEMFLDDDEAGAEWEGETQQNDSEETPKMAKKRIPVHIMATHPKMTQMLIDDSNINIEAWLSNKVSDKFSRTEAASFVTGNGVGKPTGFGTYPAWDTAGTYQRKAIEQVNMGHATQFTTDGLQDVKYSLIEQYLNRGTWLTNRLNVRDIMKLKDGDGTYIWREGITEAQPATLLGLPIRMSTTVATAAASALAIYLADWRESYLIVDRQGINVQRDPFTKKPFIEFYTRKRVGGDVINYQSIKIGKIAA
jgi:HK97 family phage major capsid protein